MISRMLPKVIVVAGTTGVGKSQLAVQLAAKFQGEIINSDSLQVYKGIPTITNKHPLAERHGIAHHLMDHVDWSEEYYLHRFEEECLKAINDLHSRGKVPIIVGGTHYYLQILFNKRIVGTEKISQPTSEQLEILDSENPQLVYDHLVKVDPEIAQRYHPNDTRRVRRMLEIYYKTGKKASAAFDAQDLKLRYDTLFYWVYSDASALNKRLDDRVDSMIKADGLNEIKQLYDYYTQNNYTKSQCENGVYQVIGFKEFLPWLENQNNVTLEDCVDQMKVRTRQYAKKQVKWIRKMLIPDIKGQIYILNATDLDKWDENVASRAFSIADHFMRGLPNLEDFVPAGLQHLIDNSTKTVEVNNYSPKKVNDWTRFNCGICLDKNNNGLILIGKESWKIHLSSRRHKANLNRGKKKKQYEEWLSRQPTQKEDSKG
ncbi:HBL323Cp [Eremothecium sinecaudum]|uniref:tRNA dimethylallyltransferase n=1 Tax=Eremothecium sinecaudum TaxID=45286 RepID=A0A109UW29_9SACH|nr:HBL323Cp [Eremothecium sinecaudum]AMD18579.1 HBL323Cp [Eremothecium sinecaudum]